MKVVVTGGAGYIGDCVVENLIQSGHDVIVLDNLLYTDSYMRPGLTFYFMDVCSHNDLEWLARAHPDVDAVVHLAAIVGDAACAEDPEHTVEVNDEATLHLTNLWPRARFIFASTCSVYGKNDDILDEFSAKHRR